VLTEGGIAGGLHRATRSWTGVGVPISAHPARDGGAAYPCRVVAEGAVPVRTHGGHGFYRARGVSALWWYAFCMAWRVARRYRVWCSRIIRWPALINLGVV
jgi:hypothetical protein